jgi:phosphate-selective porin OprO and OprP
MKRAPTLRSLVPLTLVAAFAVGGAGASAQSAAPAAPAPEPTLESIQQQIEALQQQLSILQRQAEIAAEAEAEKAKTGAAVSASANDGFALQSDDGSFALELRGYVQVDGRWYANDSGTRSIDTVILRRVRPILEGTVHKRFGFRVMPDFGSGATLLQDAYVEWRFSPAAVLRAGKYKAPFGLERLQSATDLAFAERALPTGLGPSRDAGIQLAGRLAGDRLDYAAGVFNGVPDGASGDSDGNDDKDLVARVMVSPWKGTPSELSGLSFGVAASRGNQEGTVAAPGLAGYRSAGQQSPANGSFFGYRSDGTAAGTAIADGERFRLSPQASFYRGPFGLLGEYVRSRHEVRRGAATTELTHTAWQLSGTWVITGENASYRWYKPAHGFDPGDDPARRGWGGVALVARYNAFAADEASFPVYAASSAVQEAKGWALGLDWSLQKQVRLLLDYEVTSFSGLGQPRADERVLFSRLQVAW